MRLGSVRARPCSTGTLIDFWELGRYSSVIARRVFVVQSVAMRHSYSHAACFKSRRSKSSPADTGHRTLDHGTRRRTNSGKWVVWSRVFRELLLRYHPAVGYSDTHIW